MDDASLQTVRQAPLFAGVKDDQLDCIRRGEVIQVPAGTILVSQDEPAEFFFVNLEGEVRISRQYDNQEVLLGVNRPGMFMGEIPLLLNCPWHATARVSKPACLFRLNQENFFRMLGTCHGVAREIFQTAASRLRNLEGYSQQREKLVSLGTMAAGLAHELNNPATAARRAASQLDQTIEGVQAHFCKLAKVLQPSEWEQLLDAEREAIRRLDTTPPPDSLMRSDLEEALTRWLDDHGVVDGWRLSPSFVNAGLDAAWLGALTGKLAPASHGLALNWLEARLNTKLLLKLVDQSTRRVAELVKAVKSYSYMDQSPMQEVDIHDGLESTLTMLGHKLKNVKLVRAYDRSAPRIMAHGSELNQVWTNLIDNAIDAVNGTGKVCVGTFVEGNQLVVEIVDDGAGIPPEIQPRIFEPFFTTKSVGSGTGLGLIISNRIVADRHGGEIEFESRPGETRFKVRLPVNRAQSTS